MNRVAIPSDSALWRLVATLLLFRHRDDLERIVRQLKIDLAPAWRMIDFGDVRGTELAWVETILPTIERAYLDIQAVTADFMADYQFARERETGEVDEVFDVLVDGGRLSRVAPTVVGPSFDRGRAAASLLAAGPGSVLSRQPAPRQESLEVGLKNSSGAATELAMAGSRDLVRDLTTGGRLRGWQRITDSDPCGFCAMLASRGPVYQDVAAIAATNAKYLQEGDPEDSAKVHWNCQCTIVPVFLDSPEPLSGWAKVAYDIFQKMNDDGVDVHNRERVRYFRRRFDAVKKRNPRLGDVDESAMQRVVSSALRSGRYRDARAKAVLRSSLR